MHKFLWLIVRLANTISHALMQASVQTFASASMREDSFKAPLGNELRDPTIDHRLHVNGPTHHLLPFFLKQYPFAVVDGLLYGLHEKRWQGPTRSSKLLA